MSILYLLAYLYVYCMLTNSMAQLDYYQAPKNLIPLQIVVHKRRSDNVIYPFDNSWVFVRKRWDADRKNIHPIRDRN